MVVLDGVSKCEIVEAASPNYGRTWRISKKLHFGVKATRGPWSIFNIVVYLGLHRRKKKNHCDTDILKEDGGGNWRPDK